MEPVRVPEIFMTITDAVETHTFSWGGGSSGAAKITPLSEVTWLIFGILSRPRTWKHRYR